MTAPTPVAGTPPTPSTRNETVFPGGSLYAWHWTGSTEATSCVHESGWGERRQAADRDRIATANQPDTSAISCTVPFDPL